MKHGEESWLALDPHELSDMSTLYISHTDCELHEMTEKACQAIDAKLTEAMVKQLSVEASVAARNHIGGTAPEQVRQQCAAWKALLES